jgi:co-chaperonin GroES (HSP10)
MIKVLGHRVLIKVPDVKEQLNKDIPEGLAKSGFIVQAESKDAERRWFEASQEGEVVQTGPMCWKSAALGFGLSDWTPWCKPGDKVKFVQYSKDVVIDPDTDEKYFVVNDVDILAIVE